MATLPKVLINLPRRGVLHLASELTQVFVYVTSISLVGSLWTWALIVLAHLGYRKSVAAGTARAVGYQMPGSPYANWFVVAFLILVTILLSLDESTRVALYVAPVWFTILGIG